MTHTRELLISALTREFDYLCHDCDMFDESVTPVEYNEFLQTLTLQQLIDETCCEHDTYTLDEYMETWL